MLLALGGVFSYLNPIYGIPFLILVFFVGLYLVVRAYGRISIKPGRWNKMLIALGAILIISGIAVIMPQIKLNNEQVKSELQIQVDSLIADITAYGKTIPPRPMPTYSKDTIEMEKLWSEYNAKSSEYSHSINSDFFSKFNTRIADTMIKLHNLNIISDSEFDQAKSFYNFMPTAYTAMPILLENL
jgi:hypothetical protein